MTTQIIHATQHTPPLREIAARLREVAATLPEDAPPEARVTVILGSLRLTLRADAQALREAADKYQRGFPARGARRYGTDFGDHPHHRKPTPNLKQAGFKEGLFFDLLATEDAATAVAYARLYSSADWSPKVIELFTQRPELLEE